MSNEPMAAKEFVDELNSQWNSSNVTEPNYIVVTGASEQIRYDLNKGNSTHFFRSLHFLRSFTSGKYV